MRRHGIRPVSYTHLDVYKRQVVIHVKTKALEDIPREGQVFTLDGEPMLVSNCVDDLGIMSITLHQNVGVGGGMDAY